MAGRSRESESRVGSQASGGFVLSGALAMMALTGGRHAVYVGAQACVRGGP